VSARILEARERETGISRVKVTSTEVEEALGPERYSLEDTQRPLPAGVVTGLAWTPVGGEILYIETTQMPGTGKLVLTGQLGDVMKESAQIALSLLRSRLPALGLSLDFEKRDLHIHVPSGAIPKDGPSAGVALLTALAALVTDHAVDSKLAMTGEITLRGAVTPVGGIREKLIAAHRSGITRVLLPLKNRKDLRDLPEEIRQQLQVEFVETVEELLQKALGLSWPTQPVPFGLGIGGRKEGSVGSEGILARY
jgi:ATP-dependent Lon protease